MRPLILILWLITGALTPVIAESSSPDRPKVGIVEKLGERLPLSVEFHDEQGYIVPLGEILNKPTIVNFVYYRCPDICSPLLTELSRIVEKLDLELGKDYQIITVSFDHQEKPELAADKKRNYLEAMKKVVDPKGWRFLTGDSAAIQTLTDAAGFYFMRDGEQWIHAGALIAVSPNGMITRYMNGIKYLPFDVKMAIYEASDERVGPTIAKVLKFCYSYDPDAKSYTFNFTRIGAVVILSLVSIFVIVFVVLPKRKKTGE